MRLRTVLLALAGVVVLLVIAAGIALSRIDFGQYKGLIEQKAEEATGRKLIVGGELKLTLFPLPAIIMKDVSFANFATGSRPQMAKLGELDARVAVLPLLIGGNVDVQKLVLKDVDVLLETDAKGQPNWQFAPSSGSSAAQKPAAAPDAKSGNFQLPTFGDVEMSNVIVAYRDGATKKTVTGSVKSLIASSSGGGPMKVNISAAYNGTPIEVRATVGAMSSLLTTGQPYAVDAEIEAAGASIKVIGSLTDAIRAHGINMNINVDGKSLADVGAVAGAPLPPRSYHLAATVTGDADKTVGLKLLSASLGSTAVSGDAEATLNGPRPKLKATIAASMVDLTELALPKSPPPRPRPGDEERIFTSEPLPLESLRAFDSDVTMTAATVKTEKLTLQNLSAQLTLDDRVLRVKPFGVDVAGSHMGGDVELNARQAPAAFALNIDGKQVDIGKILLQASGNDLLEGRGDIGVSVHGTGDSPHAIAASLGGNSNLVMGQGRIKSRYADLIGADVFREAFAWAKGKEDTKLNCMVSRFDIQNGLATSRALLMDTADVTMLGAGTVNFGSERLDLVLKPKPKETSLVNLAVPIDVSGTFKHPSILPNKAGVAKEVALGVASAINPLALIVPMVMDSGGDKNPCVAALEGDKGKPAATDAKSAPKSEGGVSGTVKSIGKSIDNLFK
ncbi:MAG TPA: AsmA family protein [Candidatus Cybelea sp.]|nr:AsmA family protein [Candidatus Cybelea sp.]